MTLDTLSQVAAVVAAVVSISLGLDLTADDFRTVARRPRVLAFALLNQLLIVPACALILCRLGGLNATLTVGVMVVAIAPASAPANLMTRLAHGNTALALTLTAVTNALCFLTMPIAIAAAAWLTGGSSSLASLPLVRSSIMVLCVCVVPLVVGVSLRHKRPDFAMRIAQPARTVSLAGVIVVVLAALWIEREAVLRSLAVVGATALLLNLGTLLITFIVAQALRVDRASRTTMCLQASLHNCALAIYVCVVYLRGTEFVQPALAYGFIMWMTAPILVALAHRQIAGIPAVGAIAQPTIGKP